MTVRRGRRVAGGFLRDFQDFALKGNVVDLAVAVIIGGAFGKIITSLVEDIIMPALVNPVLSRAGVDWREAVIGPGIKLGSFVGAIVDFLIIALILFLIIRAIERIRRAVEFEEAAAPTDPLLASQENLTGAIERLTQVMESK